MRAALYLCCVPISATHRGLALVTNRAARRRADCLTAGDRGMGQLLHILGLARFHGLRFVSFACVAYANRTSGMGRIGGRFDVQATCVRMWPREIVGAARRGNYCLTAIEHARSEWVAFPICWPLCSAQKFTVFFLTNRI